MADTIPLSATPAQSLSVELGDQSCQIDLYMVGTRLYLDLSVDDTAIVQGVLCQDRVRLVGLAYYGFSGDLSFVDLQGKSDPVYTDLGNRFVLVYLP